MLNPNTIKAFHTLQNIIPQKAWGTSIQTKTVEDLAGSKYENGANPLDMVIAFLVGCLFIILVIRYHKSTTHA